MADPVRVGWLPRPQKSFQEIRRHREGRVSKNITLQEISLKELDRSKDSCRKLCRRCEISLEDFKISRGSNKRNRGHWEFYLLGGIRGLVCRSYSGGAGLWTKKTNQRTERCSCWQNWWENPCQCYLMSSLFLRSAPRGPVPARSRLSLCPAGSRPSSEGQTDPAESCMTAATKWEPELTDSWQNGLYHRNYETMSKWGELSLESAFLPLPPDRWAFRNRTEMNVTTQRKDNFLILIVTYATVIIRSFLTPST